MFQHNTNTNIPQTSLAAYLRETLFDNWKNNRRDIELKWQKNLDAYKSESSEFWRTSEESEDWMSDTFIGITKIKVLSAWSLVSDMILQGGRLPFMLKPAVGINPIEFDELTEEQAEPLRDSIEDQEKLLRQQLKMCGAEQEFLKSILSAALYGETYIKRYVKAKNLIAYHNPQQQQPQPQYPPQPEPVAPFPTGQATAPGPAGEMMGGSSIPPVVDPAGNLAQMQPPMQPQMQPMPMPQPQWEMAMQETLSPAISYVSVWDIYRDLESDDLREGVGVFQRKLISAYDLREKKELPYYLPEAIDDAIRHAEQPGTAYTSSDDVGSLTPGLRDIPHRENTIEYLEFWGRVPRVLADEFEKDQKSNKKDEVSDINPEEMLERSGDEVEIHACLADQHVVRFVRVDPDDPLQQRPYYRAVWEIGLDGTHGIGIADNLEDIQKVINGAVRAFEDNKKYSSTVMLGIKRRYFARNKMPDTLKPGTIFDLAEECDDVRKAIQPIVIPDVGETLLSLIQTFERYADEGSLIPKAMQGQTHDKNRPDTAFEFNQLMQKAGKYLAVIIKNMDDGLLKPMITDMYHYNMSDPELQTGKGNFACIPLGFSSYQDRMIRVEKLQQFLNMTMGNEMMAGEVDIRQVLTELSQALDLEPDQVLLSQDEKAQRAQMAQTDPIAQLEIEQRQAEIAKLNAETEKNMAEIRLKEKDAQNKKVEIMAKTNLERQKAVHGST